MQPFFFLFLSGIIISLFISLIVLAEPDNEPSCVL